MRAAGERGLPPHPVCLQLERITASAHQHRVAALQPREEALCFALLNAATGTPFPFQETQTGSSLGQQAGHMYQPEIFCKSFCPPTGAQRVTSNETGSFPAPVALRFFCEESYVLPAIFFQIRLYESRDALLGKGGMVTSPGTSSFATQVPWGYFSCAV